ncbi:hypothetical protein KOR34_21630 [Posidoniimonas corsicana]|uniref:PEP-CTERM protein-sorting domain-containing protein n=1 Tax=Posidoniimonas corsicana TaxID=1938618 RepID=A0A5C5VEY7_9BACT|nr:hypothetical protein [Posidoniimonas corsicana]TWT37216.1 hypothetical protein KOR34_21630 [Posidoniimonas corsicana]
MLLPTARRTCVFAVCVASVSLAALVHGQTVFNAPPSTIPDAFNLNSGDVLNVGAGGVVGTGLRANAGSIINVEGGTVGVGFSANAGSQVAISGGTVSGFMTHVGSVLSVSGGMLEGGAWIGGMASISGGAISRPFRAVQGSAVNFVGAEFMLSGVPVAENTVTLDRFTNADGVLTGTFEDGSPFIFSPLGRYGSDELQDVTLTSVAIPAADLRPRSIATDISGDFAGMRSGQEFTVLPGGVLPGNFSAVEATLSVEGGEVGRNLKVASGTVSLTSGSIGDYFYAYPGSTVYIDGGSVGAGFEAFDSDVTITDGRVGNLLQAHAGTTVNMTGGRVDSIEAHAGSRVVISGGTVGFGGNVVSSVVAAAGSEIVISGGGVARSLRTVSGAGVELIGGEFSLNGAAFAGTNITLGDGDVFTGALSDGSAFIFPPLHGDRLEGVSLTRVPLAPADTTPRVVDTPQTKGPSGLRPGQRLTLRHGGTLQANFAVVGGTLEVEGGDAGAGVEVVGGSVDISGGVVGAGLRVQDARVDMSSGSIGERSAAYRGAVVSITGGNVGTRFNAFEGSRVTLAGGSVGPSFRTWEGSDVEFVGGEFQLNGEDYDADEITLVGRGGPVQVFAGVLSDGTPFVFSPQANPIGEELRDIKLTRTSLPVADLNPKVLDTPLGNGVNGLRPGQELTLVDGGELPDNFTAIGATLNVAGGRVGRFAEVVDSTVRISGGKVDVGFQAHNSQVEITGGEVGALFEAFPGTVARIDGASVRGIGVYADAYVELFGGSEVEYSVQVLSGSELKVNDATIGGSIEAINGRVTFTNGSVGGSFGATASDVVIDGGSVDGSVTIFNNSKFRISGGSHAARISVGYGGRLEISGGQFTGGLTHREGTVDISGGDFWNLTSISVADTLNLFGLEFYLDGMPLTGLTPHLGVVVPERDQTLSGILADGTPFSFDLNSTSGAGLHFFSTDARLTVTLVPEPTTVWLAILAGCSLLSVRSRACRQE